MDQTIRDTVQAHCTATLQHVRRTLEAEALAWAQAGVNTQAFWGKLELLAAVGAELDSRDALLPATPFVDLCTEDGIRYSVQVRVF